jgi:hypothetical protein
MISSLTRRAALVGSGGAAGLLLGGGLTATLRPAPASHDEIVRALASSLTPLQRRLMIFPADDPTRQIANTIAVLERPHLGTLLSSAQMALVEHLYDSMLSPRGRQALARTVATEGRLSGCVLAIYGEPESGTARTVISGGHLLVRGGGEREGGSVLGGATAYGHQKGNGRWRVPGNAFAYHGDAANRLFAALSAEQQARAVLSSPPHELTLQLQDQRGRFPGAPLGGLTDAGREAASGLLDAVLGLYPAEAGARARAAIEANGGLERLHFACFADKGFYRDMRTWASLDPAERAGRGTPYWQVWRLEGPGTVVHFQGHPHVHAYLHIARDPARANIGEVLADTSVAIQGPAMRSFIEGAFRRATGEALAYAWPDWPGRFCPGEITTGLANAVDPFRESIVLAEIDGPALAAPLRERLRLAPTGRHRVATTAYLAGERALFGQADRVVPTHLPVREAIIAHLRGGGLRSAAAPPG